MLSARAIYHEILNDDTTCALFLSVASSGEAQGGWENARIAELTRDPVLRAKIERHGHDEDKHARLFGSVMRRRGLEPLEVPEAADYTGQLERAGIGLSHARLAEDRPLEDSELIAYLVHSRVTEQRAAEEVALQRKLLADDPLLGKPLGVIAEDEANHLAYCHEELLRFCEAGHADEVEQLLQTYAKAEVGTYRRVSLEVMGQMAEALAWPRWKRLAIRLGIEAVYVFERAIGWRRATRLRTPERVNAMGGPEPANQVV